jgi:hypothetical protein
MVEAGFTVESSGPRSGGGFSLETGRGVLPLTGIRAGGKIRAIRRYIIMRALGWYA